MKDRKANAPGRYSAVVPSEDVQKLQNGEAFSITLIRDDDPVEQGTPYSKWAVLPDEVAAVICPNVEDPTPADAFLALQNSKAPAGYGLGETSARRLDITKMSQLDEITAIGWYSFHLPTLLQVNGVWLNYAYMLVENWDVSSVKQTLYVLNNESTTLTRRKFEGIWKEWECENPPMLFGVEYRTTERWNGKPVYTKLVDVDYYIKLDTEEVIYIASDVDSLVDAKFTVWNNGYPIGGSYTIMSDDLDLAVLFDGRLIQLEINVIDRARWSGATLLLKYTKTNTD